MEFDFQKQRLDDAFDAIEGAVLPNLAMMIGDLLDDAEAGRSAIAPKAYAAELRALGSELEALTKAFARSSPAASVADVASRSVAA